MACRVTHALLLHDAVIEEHELRQAMDTIPCKDLSQSDCFPGPVRQQDRTSGPKSENGSSSQILVAGIPQGDDFDRPMAVRHRCPGRRRDVDG